MSWLGLQPGQRVSIRLTDAAGERHSARLASTGGDHVFFLFGAITNANIVKIDVIVQTGHEFEFLVPPPELVTW
jgi:hypothetical protein